MVSFFAQRGWLLGAAVLIFAIAAIAAWLVSGSGLWLSAVLGVSIVIGGLGVLAFARMIRAIRELYQLVIQLRDDVDKVQDRIVDLGVDQSSVDALRGRLALAERRLSALAVKLEMSDELDNRPPA
jgi:hypothetical protein